MGRNAPRRIMLATDLTPAGDRAFDRAVQLAGQWKAELTVCHVIESSALRPWGMERKVRNAESELERLVRSAKLSQKVPRHIVVGDPAQRTLEHASAIDCDFLVTGPAHGKAIGEKLLGSTAARMVRRSSYPVLAVRRRPDGPYNAVTAAVDFSSVSLKALQHGRALFPDAGMTLVHAYQVVPNYGGVNANKSIDVVEAEEKVRVVEAAGQEMTELIAAAKSAAKGAVTHVLLEGEPDAVLLDHVERTWPDLVITGTRGRGEQGDDVIGSVAETLLMRLPCDVLAFPTRG